jgi:hypothetical protein
MQSKMMIKCSIVDASGAELFAFRMPRRSGRWYVDNAKHLTNLVKLFSGVDMLFSIDK